MHFAVGELDHLVVHQHAVGRQRKAEILAGFLLPPAGIGHKALHDVPVHQRLAAEEVHLEIGMRAAVLNQKIQRALAHVKRHQRPLAVILALTGKAVGAVQVAGVRHVQAQRLHVRLTALEVDGEVAVFVLGVQLSGILQGADVVHQPTKLLFVHVGARAVLHQKLGNDLVLRARFIQRNRVIRHVVHHVHRAGEHVQHDIVSIQLILVNHSFPLP